MPSSRGRLPTKRTPTQVGRALARLGIDPRIRSGGYSAEARGRSERAFRTLQRSGSASNFRRQPAEQK